MTLTLTPRSSSLITGCLQTGLFLWLLLLVAPLAHAQFQEVQQIEEPRFGVSNGDLMGQALDMDGQWAVFSSVERYDDEGAIHLYRFDGTDWNFFQELDGVGVTSQGSLGFSVALSGSRLAVGMPVESTLQGRVFIFEFNGTDWARTATLTANDAANNDQFGFDVDLEGDRLAVGANAWGNATKPNNNEGAAYIFEFDGTNWVQQALLNTSDGSAGDLSCQEVALDGDRLLCRSPGKTVGGVSNAGGAYVFHFDGTSWSEEARLEASTPLENAFMSSSVDLNGDVAVLGATRYSTSATDTVGAAYVFRRNGLGTWVQEQLLEPSNGGDDDFFGLNVAVEGNRIIVASAAFDAGGLTNTGAYYEYSYDGTNWIEETSFSASSALPFDVDGNTDDMVLKGDTLLTSGNYGLNVGGGRLYTFDGSNWGLRSTLLPYRASRVDQLGTGLALDGNIAAAAGLGYEDPTDTLGNTGKVNVYSYDGSSWVDDTTLIPAGLQNGERFGRQVRLDGTTLVVGGGETRNAVGDTTGALYVFENTSGTWAQTARLIPSTAGDGDNALATAFDVDGIALAKSPENLMPPSAITGTSPAAAAQSITAVICGMPTPATIRVVQMLPGPIPTLTASAPAPISARVASAVATLPATICTLLDRPLRRSTARDTPSEWPCAVSITIMSTPASTSA